MNTEKNINTRIIHKHDIETNWNKATNFIPKQGELIIYDKDQKHSQIRLKIGNGITKINDLPFSIDEILIGTTTEITPSQVKALMDEGKPFAITHTDSTYGTMLLNSFVYSQNINTVLSSAIFSLDGITMSAQVFGDISNNTWTSEVFRLVSVDDIPSSLKNPHALTINGISYDGSEAKTVNMPTALKNPNPIRFTGAVSESYDGSSTKFIEILGLDETLTDSSSAAPANSVAQAMHVGLIADKDAITFTTYGLIARAMLNMSHGIEPAHNMFVHVTDIVPTLEELEYGFSIVGSLSKYDIPAMGMRAMSIEIPAKEQNEEIFDFVVSTMPIGSQEAITISMDEIPLVVIVPSDDATSIFPKKGVYFTLAEELAVNSLKINNFSFASSGESYDDTEIKELIQNNTADIQTIINDYLKSSDKYDDTEVRSLIQTIADDYLKSSDKYNDTEVRSLIQTNTNNISTNTNNIQTIINDYLKSSDKYDDTEVRGLIDTKMNKTNPVGTGSFSMNRKSGTTVGNYSHAEGEDTIASAYASHAEGWQTTASGEHSHTEGFYTTASSTSSHAEGQGTTASGEHSHAEGSYTTASSTSSHAEGWQTTASGEYSHAEGYETTASGDCAHTEGLQTKASGEYSHAEGQSAKAFGNCAHAEGQGTTASGNSSHAEGQTTKASGQASHAEGQGTNYQIVITGDANATTYTCIKNGLGSPIKDGYVLTYNNVYAKITNVDGSSITVDKTLSSTALSEKEVRLVTGIAHGNCAHAEGVDTTASSTSSHAEGYNTVASGYASHAEGQNTTASGEKSHAEGYNTVASSNSSHAEGHETEASGYASHVEGQNTTASGYASHAEGQNTTASGTGSHTEGHETEASGQASHAEGQNTEASGDFSHAEGYNTVASGTGSHTEGLNTTASNECSHAEGVNTIASGKNSHVQGKYNKVDTNNRYAHIVGNGMNDQNRSNAHTIDWGGNAWYSGNVYVGSTSGINRDEGSKKLATEEFVNNKGYLTSFTETDPTVPAWAKATNKPTYTASEVGALPADTVIPNSLADLNDDATHRTVTDAEKNIWNAKANVSDIPDVSSQISNHNTAKDSHNDIRLLIEGLSTRLNTLANSDDTTLDQMSEVVTYIKNNKSLIDGITTSKVNVADIVNNLTTNVSNKPLSAAQGVTIKGLIDALQIELDTHTDNTTVHITSTERANWNAAKSHADSAHAPSNAQPNQNAFSNVKIGDTTIAADNTTDTLTLVGSNVTITPDATNDKVTIGITKDNVTSALGYTPPTTNTTYGEVSTTAAGLAPKRDGSTTKFLRADGTWAVPPDNNTTYGVVSTTADGLAPKRDGSTTKFLRADGTWAVPPDTNTTYTLSSFGITATATELNYADGVTSNIQTQLNNKASNQTLNSHTDNTTVHITSTERTNWNAAKTHADSAHAPSNAEKNQNAFSNIKVGSTTIAANTTTDTLELVGSNVTITPDATNDKVTFSVADGSTSTKGVVKLENSTSSASTTTAATPSSVKSAYDKAATAITNAATAQARANAAYSLAESKVDSLSDLGITATAAELNYIDGVTSNIQTQLDNHTHNYLPLGGGNISGHIYLTGAKANSSTSNTSQIIFGTSTDNHIALSSNNNALVINPDAKSTNNQIVLYLDKASVFPNGISGTASRATADGSGNNIVNTYATKTELGTKQATITGAATTVTSSNLTASRALVSNSSGKIAVSDVTSTELGYLSGAKSSVQTQLDDKISTSRFNDCIQAEKIPDFTDVLKNAKKDSSGAIFNEIGYIKGGKRWNGPDGTLYDANVHEYGCTGYIPVTNNQIIRTKGIHFNNIGDDGYCVLVFYDSSFKRIVHVTAPGLNAGTATWYTQYTATEDGFEVKAQNMSNLAYVTITTNSQNISDNPVITINQPITYHMSGTMSDGIEVNGAYTILTAPNGTKYKLSVSNTGALSAVAI